MSIPLGAHRCLTITVVSASAAPRGCPLALAAVGASDAELAKFNARRESDIERVRWDTALLLRGLPVPR